jgi:hypothetical protein
VIPSTVCTSYREPHATQVEAYFGTPRGETPGPSRCAAAPFGSASKESRNRLLTRASQRRSVGRRPAAWRFRGDAGSKFIASAKRGVDGQRVLHRRCRQLHPRCMTRVVQRHERPAGLVAPCPADGRDRKAREPSGRARSAERFATTWGGACRIRGTGIRRPEKAHVSTTRQPAMLQSDLSPCVNLAPNRLDAPVSSPCSGCSVTPPGTRTHGR